jgi:hypothetical protein
LAPRRSGWHSTAHQCPHLFFLSGALRVSNRFDALVFLIAHVTGD